MSFGRMLSVALAISAASASLVPWNFVHTSGENFVLNGKKFHFAGTNAYWFSFLSNIADVATSMDQAKAHGLQVIRTWAFNEVNATTIAGGLPQYGGEGAGPTAIYFRSWANGTGTINHGSNGLPRLDQVVSLAEKKGIKLVMTLTNNWADYGGMDVMTINLGGKYHDDFYTNPKVIAAYKTYIAAIVTRYRHSSAIFSWQLGNEPRCGADGTRNLPRSPSGCTAATITAWADEISRYIKTLDPFHMVSVGVEGFFNRPNQTDWAYGGNDGVDFDALQQLKDVDYGTFHLYPDWWSKDPLVWAPQFIDDHIASQKKYKKPAVMEEYGWLLPEDRLSWLGVTSNVTRVQAESLWQNHVVKGKLAGDQFWQLGTKLTDGSNSTDDGFTEYLFDPSAKILVDDHVKAMNALNGRSAKWWWPW